MIPTRRRFLSLASAACLMAPAANAFQWHGTALGAQTRIILDHPNAGKITQQALHEISRLENIFSLYRPNSEISRLNLAGHLDAPSFELLDCLSTARYVHGLTEGRFDPTVQPLWRVHANAYEAGLVPEPADVEAARRKIGFERIMFDSTGISLSMGQQITLNGIAQGYIADRIALLMRSNGVKDALIDTGEFFAMGAPDGRVAWPVGIVGDVEARALSGRALATSAPFGTRLDHTGQVGHILAPHEALGWKTKIRQVSVSASHAALADALSTGICAAKDANTARRLLRYVKDARLENVQLTRDRT